ncbi:glycosyltransferase 87 family protein [Streptomyces thermoviolaceus]|uniref:glycosyltransferase 87 family protein n=1 Tax=Streptomyces thermoviolaceus TaxID=1952 RepID=UPI00386BC232|nr:glycosyltransferase 87 family protein [Streptomyces thermoviolaceus]
MDEADARRRTAALLAVWTATRAVLVLCVLRVLVLPGPDVGSDVSVIYRGWYEVLRHGSFPVGDVAWQYPPGAALAVLSPAVLPFLDYATAFLVLALLADLVVLGLLLAAGRGADRSPLGAWVWTAGAAAVGPTLYARYDVLVTAVAVAALLAGARHPRVLGVLAGLGALLKGWPLLLLAGARGTAGRRAWGAAVLTAAAGVLVAVSALPGALSFLSAQRDRGTEVESVGALVFHLARWAGWDGRVELRYGSMEFTGSYVAMAGTVAQVLTAAGLVWLLAWRLRAHRSGPHTLADAAFTAVLLCTVTSRVISPQYLVWLAGLGAVCLCFAGSTMRLPVALVLVAAGVTVLEFPVFFADVVASDGLGVGLLVVRNGLLVAACLLACRALWRATVPPVRAVSLPGQVSRSREGLRET